MEQAKEQVEKGQGNAALLPKKRRRKKKWLKRALVLALAVLFLAGAALFLLSRGGGAPGEILQEMTAKVERGTVQTSLSSSGTLAALDSYSVTALVSGEVVAADFEEGDQVQEGDVLYRVDTDSVETQISSAYKQVERAQEDYEEALADYREAASHYDSLDYVTPSGGYVRSVSVQEGSAVQEGAALVELYDDGVMQLDVPFAASVAEGISVGDAASVTVNRTMDVLTGTVAAVEDHEDAASGGAVTRTVTIEVKNPGGLSEGMTASAEVNGMPCSADGTFSAPDGTTVTADYGGKIEEVFVAEGDYLEAGDALFRFTADSVQDQLESLERTLENAENSLEDAKDSLENQQDQLADYEITAPISGQVVQKNVKAGENLNAGTSQGAMAVIYDMSALTFEMSIDETDVLDVAVGQTVQVTADALPEESYTGVVTNVSLVSSSSNGVTVYPVTVRIDEPGNLLPGMNVSADIVLEESADTLVVPVSALQRGNVVYVRDDAAEPEDGVPEGYRAVEVETGLVNETYVEILGGLQEGDEVYLSQTASSGEEMFPDMMGGSFGGMGGGSFGDMGGAPGGMGGGPSGGFPGGAP